MEIKAYIEAGNLEQYCFGLFHEELGTEIGALQLAHPEISKELNEIEQTIEKFAESQAVFPRPELKDRILTALFADDIIDLNNLPPTSQYANYESWLKAVEHLIPAEPLGDFVGQVLRQDKQIAQTLVITKLNVPDEIHDVISESFFILKGTCICQVGQTMVTLNAGDYLEIPLHTNHNIRIQSPYVVAILQHRFA